MRRRGPRAGPVLGRALVEILFPEGGCAVCGRTLASRLAWSPEVCPVCLEGMSAGRPVAGFLDSPWVEDGRRWPFAAAGLYDGPLETAVLRLKKVPDRRLAAFLAGFMVERLAERFAPVGSGPAGRAGRAGAVVGRWDAVVPVPLHSGRLRSRGFNQAEILASELATLIEAPLQSDLCRRVRNTPVQSGLSRERRRMNVAGAFRVKPGAIVNGAHCLVVDDVLTTGATAADVARALEDVGAAEVLCVAVARAP